MSKLKLDYDAKTEALIKQYNHQVIHGRRNHELLLVFVYGFRSCVKHLHSSSMSERGIE
jgi:hypothetical protein